MSLKKQAVSGMFWVFLDYFLLKGVSFLGTFLLARMLTPSDFGLMGMIYIIVQLGLILIDSGLSSSLIRNSNNDSLDYSTIFYSNVFIGLILYILFFLAAPFIASFYDQELLTQIIRVYSLCFFCASFISVQTTIMIKDMDFKKLMYLNIPGSLLGVGVAYFMADNGYGVWSIVGMALVTQIVQVVSIWLGASWKPKLEFSFERLKYHYAFGFRLLISSTIAIVFGNIYYVVIGKFYPLKLTGYYERANTLGQYLITVLVQIIGKVTLPLMSGLQEENERFDAVFKKLVGFTFFVTAPIMLGFSAISKPLILLFLGEAWTSVIPILQIICLGCMFQTLHALNVNVLKIYGRSDLILKGEILLKVFLILTLTIAYYVGFYGIVFCVVINSFANLLVNIYCVSKVVKFSLKQQLITILPTFVAAFAMCLFVIWIGQFLDDFQLVLRLVFVVSVGAILFGIFSYLLKNPYFFYMVNLLREKVLKRE